MDSFLDYSCNKFKGLKDDVIDFIESYTSDEQISEFLARLAQLNSVNLAVLKKLIQNSIMSTKLLSTLEESELVKVGFTPKRAENLISDAVSSLYCIFKTGYQIFEERKTAQRLKTHVVSIDNLLKGGLETQAIIELAGEFGSGKTYFAHHCAVTTQLSKTNGGLEGSVLIIDTENTFRPERIAEVAQRFNLDPIEVLKHIHVNKPKNSEAQCLLMKSLASEPIEKVLGFIPQKPVKLIIIDSLIAKFRQEFVGRGTLSDRQQKLGHFLGEALNVAIEKNLIILVTNQVTAIVDSLFAGPTMKPIGGHVVGHSATYRLFIRKSKQNFRIIQVRDAPDIGLDECLCQITPGGLRSSGDTVYTN